jgi:hypothetical protein
LKIFCDTKSGVKVFRFPDDTSFIFNEPQGFLRVFGRPWSPHEQDKSDPLNGPAMRRMTGNETGEMTTISQNRYFHMDGVIAIADDNDECITTEEDIPTYPVYPAPDPSMEE